MHDDAGLPQLVRLKIDEQLDRLGHLAGLIPAAHVAGLDWRPPLPAGVRALSLGALLHHLLDCVAGFAAVLQAAQPEAGADLAALRSRLAAPLVNVADFEDRLRNCKVVLVAGFAALTDNDLGRVLPTVFVPQGEAVLTLLLGNFEHLVHHKFQLFFYLKMMGVPLGTPDLYVLRGSLPG